MLTALRPNFKVGRIWQVEEFPTTNPAATRGGLDAGFTGAAVERLPLVDFAPVTAALAKIGHTGYLAAEVFPCPSPDEAGRQTNRSILQPI